MRAAPAAVEVRHDIPAAAVAAGLRAVTGVPAAPAVCVVAQVIGTGPIAGDRGRPAARCVPGFVGALPGSAPAGTTDHAAAAAVLRIPQHIGHDPVAGYPLLCRALGRCAAGCSAEKRGKECADGGEECAISSGGRPVLRGIRWRPIGLPLRDIRGCLIGGRMRRDIRRRFIRGKLLRDLHRCIVGRHRACCRHPVRQITVHRPS